MPLVILATGPSSTSGQGQVIWGLTNSALTVALACSMWGTKWSRQKIQAYFNKEEVVTVLNLGTPMTHRS